MDSTLTSKKRYYIMRELTTLSLNLIFIKDLIQETERYKNKLLYMRILNGSLEIVLMDLHSKKAFLKKRIKNIIENVLVKKEPSYSHILLDLPDDTVGITKRDLDSSYATLMDIYDNEYILDLRQGYLFPMNEYNAAHYEYRKNTLGGVYRYFKIDPKDPLKVYDIMY